MISKHTIKMAEDALDFMFSSSSYYKGEVYFRFIEDTNVSEEVKRLRRLIKAAHKEHKVPKVKK
jgi:hypothetical protein